MNDLNTHEENYKQFVFILSELFHERSEQSIVVILRFKFITSIQWGHSLHGNGFLRFDDDDKDDDDDDEEEEEEEEEEDNNNIIMMPYREM